MNYALRTNHSGGYSVGSTDWLCARCYSVAGFSSLGHKQIQVTWGFTGVLDPSPFTLVVYEEDEGPT